MEISLADLASIRDLYYRGLYLQAWQQAQAYGPLRSWRGVAARLMAGRLAIQLGAPKLGHKLLLAAYRESPSYLEAVYYYARYRLDRFGPDAALRFMREQEDWSDAAPGLRSDWLGVYALAYARLNDFDRAFRYIHEAEAGAVDRPWILVEKSAILELADRKEEALEAAHKALELQPWFRPAVQAKSQILWGLGNTEEALQWLHEADHHLESSAVNAQHAAMLLDEQKYELVLASLDRFEANAVLLENDSRKWLHARRADVHYFLGDFPKALAYAREVDDDFYKQFSSHLEQALPVQVVHPGTANTARVVLGWQPARQDQPAEPLKLLADFFEQPLQLGESDDSMPQDGLPDFAMRRQLEQAGWLCRPFTLNQKSAKELLSLGLPFLIQLVETGFSQARFVSGVDLIRDSLIIHDGTEPLAGEAPFRLLSKRYGIFGPYALAALPNPRKPEDAEKYEQAAQFKALELPDESAWNDLYQLQLALDQQKFTEAASRLDLIRANRPHERITKLAALGYARGIGHTVLLAEAAEDLLKDYPNDSTMTLILAAAHRDLGKLNLRREVLEHAIRQGNEDPLILQSLAQMLLLNPAESYRAELLLRRSLRLRPFAAPGYYLRGILYNDQTRFDLALDAFRFAVCLDDREEQFFDAYTKNTRAHNRSGDAIKLYQYRAQRGPVPSVSMVKALFNALDDRNDSEFAWTALDKAIQTCRDYVAKNKTSEGEQALGQLLLFRAEQHACLGRHELAQEDLHDAEPYVPEALFVRLTGRLARLKPNYTAALQAVKQLVALEPMNVDNFRLLAGLLADVEGRSAAKQALRDWAAKLQNHYGLAKFQAEFFYPDHDDEAVQVTKSLLDLCPRDAWAYRQLALLHADRKEHELAKIALEQSQAIEPNHQSYFTCAAHAFRRADQPETAIEIFRKGLELYPDHELAIFEFVQLSRGLEEKKAALRFLEEILHSKPHNGDGLAAYFQCAMETVSEPEDLERLVEQAERFLEERPDLWQSWSVAVQALSNHQRTQEAHTTAAEACERFPMNVRSWLDHAITARLIEQPEERLEYLEKAVRAAPNWLPATREYASALVAVDRREDAVLALERLVYRSPIDPLAHWLLAEALWEADRGREALERAKLAVQMDTFGDPRIESAWSAIQTWAERLELPREAVEFAKQLAEDRAGDTRAWLRYARCISEVVQIPEILRALDRTLELDPTNVEAYDLKAERLAAIGQFDEALKAANPKVFPGETPLVLQGRSAWIEARRGNYPAAITQMQALVAIDPDYLWGWQQLAEWYSEVGQSESYLQATNELCRLRPDHPTSLTMRGEANLQVGNREQGKNDLRDALRTHPGYSPAAVILFDACLEDGEHRDARTALSVLQEHLTGPEVIVKQIQFSARTDDSAGALRSFRELAKTTGETPAMFMQMGITELTMIQKQTEAMKILREAWESEDEDDQINPWSAIFWLDSSDGEAADDETKLAACDAILKKYPSFVPAYDRRAEQLTNMARYEEALATCRSQDPAPTALLGREAWVTAASGNKQKAVSMMNEVLQQEPDYSWGWRQLTFWQEDLGNHRECLAAADQLVRLNPTDPFAYAVRGEARRNLGDNRGAKDDFARAFELDPSFQAAGLQLVTTQLEVDDLSGAAKALEILQRQNDGPFVRLRQLQLAAREGNLELTRLLFRKLLTGSTVYRSLLIDAIEEFQSRKWSEEALDELRDVVRQAEGLTSSGAELYVQEMVKRQKFEELKRSLGPLMKANTAAGRAAVLAYAQASILIADYDAVRNTIQLFADYLRSDDETWARSGGLLFEAKQPKLAAAWLGDWREREQLETWMYRPVFDAFLVSRQIQTAEFVAKQAVANKSNDDETPDFLAWLALFHALRGETDAADDFLDRVEPVGLPDGVRVIHTFAQTLIMVQQAENRPQAFHEAKQEIETATGSITLQAMLPETIYWYHKTLSRLAKDVGTWGARFWAYRQRYLTKFPKS